MTEPSSTETRSTGLAPGVGSAHRDVSAAVTSVSAAPVDNEARKRVESQMHFKFLDGRIVQVDVVLDESVGDVMTRVAAVTGKSADTLGFVIAGRRCPVTDLVREHWDNWQRAGPVHVSERRPQVVVESGPGVV